MTNHNEYVALGVLSGSWEGSSVYAINMKCYVRSVRALRAQDQKLHLPLNQKPAKNPPTQPQNGSQIKGFANYCRCQYC